MVRTREKEPTAAQLMAIAGGFVRLDVACLMSAWRDCQSPSGPGNGGFRSWLACREMKARRFAIAIEDGRSPAYGFPELARLMDVSVRTARSSVRRLVSAGLLEWSESAIEFPATNQPPPVTISDLSDSIGGGRGSLAIPRRLLRHLARGAKPAVIATVLGMIARCLSRRRGGFDSRGRVKSGWIARAFGVDVRSVKRARKELVDLGWISPESSDQRAENRWGRAYRINLAWVASPVTRWASEALPTDRSTISEVQKLPPLPPPRRTEFATPSFNPDPLPEREKDQDPAGRGSSGVEIRGTGKADTNSVPAGIKPVSSLPAPAVPATRQPSPAPATSNQPGSSPTPVRSAPALPTSPSPDKSATPSVLPVPNLADVRTEDLRDVGRTLELHRQAVARGQVGSSENDRLKFVALAEYARDIGTVNPGGLFALLVRRGAWHFARQAEEDVARRKLREHLHGPARPARQPAARVSSFVPDTKPIGPASLASLLARFAPCPSPSG
jgi:hypothetical protein